MVTKELIGAIFKQDVTGVTHVPYIPGVYEEGFSYTTVGEKGHFINIYELCYRGKKWSKALGYTLESRVTQNMNGACKVKRVRVLTEVLHKTETDAILDALEYVYNLDTGNNNAVKN